MPFASKIAPILSKNAVFPTGLYRSLLTLAVVAFGGVLLLAATSAPAVLEAEGLGPVRVGMTLAAAQRILATPLVMDWSGTGNKTCGTGSTRTRDRQGISYMIENGRVTRVEVDRRGVRTRTGIGIGSTISQVRVAYRGRLRVSTNVYSDEPLLEVKSRDHRHGLIFDTHDGRVVSLRGGVYPSVAYIEGCL